MLFALYLRLYQSRAQDRWDGREALSQPPHAPGEALAPELIYIYILFYYFGYEYNDDR